jgi:hypothetical protein
VSISESHVANTIATVQACVRRRLLRVFVRRGLLPRDDARAMGQWAWARILRGRLGAHRSRRSRRLERLLRYCARPPLALEQPHEFDAEQHVDDHGCEWL